jgi:hypothetical protein
MQVFLSDFVISIVPTLVISRVLLWITKGWTNSFVRLVMVHAASLVLCVVRPWSTSVVPDRSVPFDTSKKKVWGVKPGGLLPQNCESAPVPAATRRDLLALLRPFKPARSTALIWTIRPFRRHSAG